MSSESRFMTETKMLPTGKSPVGSMNVFANLPKMSGCLLRINFQHLRKEIYKDYLSSLNTMQLMFVLCLLIIEQEGKLDLNTVYLENEKYHKLLHELRYRDIEQVLTYLNLTMHVHMLSDMIEYTDDFIRLRFKDKKKKYLSMSIDSGCYFCVALNEI